MAQKHSKMCLFLAKNVNIGEMCFRASPMVGKCCKMSMELVFVEESERIIQIGPDTAEMSRKYPKNGLKQPKLGDF